jgi:ParB family chromosome partitioning protein
MTADKITISRIKVGSRFRKDLGDLDTLAKSIQETGLLHPIVINQKDELIAGARRLEACKSRLGWTEIPITRIDLDNIAKGELDENTLREDFKFSERVAILREIERQRSNLERDDDNNKGKRSAEIAADYVDVSPAQLYKEKKLLQTIKNNRELEYLVKEIDDENLTVHHATEIVKEAQERRKDKLLPFNGLHNIVLYHNYGVATVNDDGSLCCWLCLIDDWSSSVAVEENNYDDSSSSSQSVVPTMYSNEDWVKHFLFYHKPGTNEFSWDKYIPHLYYKKPDWMLKMEHKKSSIEKKKKKEEEKRSKQ